MIFNYHGTFISWQNGPIP